DKLHRPPLTRVTHPNPQNNPFRSPQIAEIAATLSRTCPRNLVSPITRIKFLQIQSGCWQRDIEDK
ncbi:MAG: hypothetical protein AAF672_13105, partial [Pseudomonadota bacterium]